MYSNTFPKELIAAGVGGLPMSWTADGSFIFDDSITQAQRDKVIAVAAAHDCDAPPPPPTALEQIRALEQAHIDNQCKLNRQAAIDTALTVACRSPAAEGKTRDEVHAIYYTTNRGYKAMVDLEAQIVELRKLIV